MEINGRAPLRRPADLVRSVVGRTLWDLAHENPVEVLATLAYVLPWFYGKSGSSPVRFWVFLASLAGYHILVRLRRDTTNPKSRSLTAVRRKRGRVRDDKRRFPASR